MPIEPRPALLRLNGKAGGRSQLNFRIVDLVMTIPTKGANQGIALVLVG